VTKLVGVLAVLIIATAAAGAESADAAVAAKGSFSTSPPVAISRWTGARRRAAEPLSVLGLPGPTGLGGSPLVEEAGAAPATSASTAAVEGVDTGDSELFPNRANGTVYGEYVIAGETELYQCSGSVIESPRGDIVLTAGHCVIDPETGTVARSLVFIPGYRETKEPFGVWAATSFVTTPEWASTAGGSDPDEAGDLALLVMADNTSDATVQETVGALGIGFEQARAQTYTQWGYPGEAPYDGEILYSNTTPYAGSDPSYSPAPLKIASDFTGGASGGPWTIGPTSAPEVLSVTDYYYVNDPHHLYGAYFGPAARQAYETATGLAVPPGPGPGGAPIVPTAAVPAPTPAIPSPATGTSPSTGAWLRIRAIHRHPGSAGATVTVSVGGPGKLRLSGSAVRTVTLSAGAAGVYSLPVAVKPGGSAARTLRRRGSAKVGVWIRFVTSGGTRQASRLVRLGAGS
jgi:V8-like Glu-specific endopeptidase